MLIKMLETRQGSEEGGRARIFRRGMTYTVSHTLGNAFLAAGFAVRLHRPPRRRRRLRLVVNQDKTS